MDDLFGAAAEARLAERAPLAARLRPRRLDDVVGQNHLIGPGGPLRVLIEADRLSSVIFWGPPGTGKTTLAEVVAAATERAFERLSAVNAGVKDVREVVERARHRLGTQSVETILFLDEVHRFNKTQQDALLPHVEDGLLTLIGATTENPFFEVNAPLLSRSTLFRLEALTVDEVMVLLKRGLDAEGATADDDALEVLADRSGGDARHALTALEVAVALTTEPLSAATSTSETETGETAASGARGAPGSAQRPQRGTGASAHVTVEHADRAMDLRGIRYERDDHYDVASAFIKSIRGSDPDAALHWMALMLAAGDDPRFIARRMVIAASEDIGLADHTSLLVATAAAQAVDRVGLPEARINLAHAVIHLATAPKSNSAYLAVNRAGTAIAEGPSGRVPPHLRDGSHPGVREFGHGVGYEYPHDDPRGWVPQQYRPPETADRTWWVPSPHGEEAERARRWRAMRTSEQRLDDPGSTQDR